MKQLMLFMFFNAENGDLFVQKFQHGNLAKVMDIFGKPNYDVKIIGARHGEIL